MATLENGDPLVATQVEVADRKLQVNLPTDPGKSGLVRIQASDGSPIDTTENNYLRVSSAAFTLYDQVDGAAVNTNLWNQSASGMTIVQSGGFIGLNAGQALTANAYAILSSIKSIPLYGTLPFSLDVIVKVLNVPESNAVVELGVGSVATNAAPTDGAFFRWTSAGQFMCVLSNAGSETNSGPLSGTLTDSDTGESISLPPTVNLAHLYQIEIVEDHARFFVDDIIVATVDTPSGQAYPFNAGRQPIFLRVYNGGSSPSLAPQLYVGQMIASQDDLNQNRPWSDTLALMGRGAYQSPITPFGQTANHANSTSPVSGTPSNTVAGYTTLGGRWQLAAVVGASTDLALFAFQVPAGYQLFINSIGISTVNTGAIGSAVTPTILDWALGVNASAVSLATADGASAWAPRRIPLGLQSFGLAAAIGATAADLVRRFETPLVVDGGRYAHLILQMPVGAATGSQVFRGDVFINGFFE